MSRSDEDGEDLFAWWTGDALTADTQFAVAPNEVALVLDGESEELVAALEPGRHGLPGALEAYGDGREVTVIFLTTTPLALEFEDSLEDVDDEPWAELKGQVQVTDPVKALELLPQVEDEAPEDWICVEVLASLSDAAQAHGGDLEALQADLGTLTQTTLASVNELLAQYGLQVTSLDLTLSETEDE